jgi:hypothetical protein
MIIYEPVSGEACFSKIKPRFKTGFLMIQQGGDIPAMLTLARTEMGDLLADRAEHYHDMARFLSSNPVLSLDYLRRSYLLTGSQETLEDIRNLTGKPENQVLRDIQSLSLI